MSLGTARHQKPGQPGRTVGGKGEARPEASRDEARLARYESEGSGRADLLGQVLARGNLVAAWKRVKANRGSAGVDGLTIQATAEYLKTHWSQIKVEQLRMQMASRVWETMKATDSRECRSCHNVDAMELSAQSDGANERHQKCITGDKTCIDCHKGIAHTLPKEFLEQEHERFVEQEVPCEDCHVNLDI